MTFPFDSKRGLIVVPAELWGPTGSVVVRLALDTGATSSLVNVGFLVAIGYDPALETERVQVTTGSGVEFAPRVIVSKLKVLGQERADFNILAHTLPPSTAVAGLLGLDFFRDRRLLIDFRTGEIDLQAD